MVALMLNLGNPLVSMKYCARKPLLASFLACIIAYFYGFFDLFCIMHKNTVKTVQKHLF